MLRYKRKWKEFCVAAREYHAKAPENNSSLLSPESPKLQLASRGLCQGCKAIVLEFPVSWCANAKTSLNYERRDHFPEFAALEASAAAGCKSCGLLRSTVLAEFRQSPLDLDPQFTDAIRSDWDHYVQIKFLELSVLTPGRGTWHQDRGKPPSFVSFEDALTGPFLLTVELLIGKLRRKIYFDMDTDPRRIKKPSDPDPLSDENIDLIKAWVRDCDENHDICNFRDHPFSPSRLVDVGTSNSGEVLRLVHTNNRICSYIALSHCWGNPSTVPRGFKTDRSNIQSRLHRILTSELPQNLQDAVTVTRRLSIQYIWIDSLCIIQDDREDWEREAAQMKLIYAHAHLTIVATNSMASTHGFLARTPYQYWKMPYRIMNYKKGRRGSFYIRSPSYNTNWKIISDSPWNRRGWTYQERALSRRMLHFTTQNLIFECCSGVEKESDFFIHASIDRPWLPEIDTAQSARKDDKYMMWYSVVSEYTRRNISFPEDKLPALSGLAYEMSQILQDDYLAGLWRRDLLRGILWQPSHDRPFSRPDRYRAPSWAWSSLDAEMNWYYDFKDATFRARVLDAEVVISGQDPLGCVSGGRLVISGEVVHISVILQDLALSLPGGSFGHGHRGNAHSDLGIGLSLNSNTWGLLLVNDAYNDTRAWHGLLLESAEGTNGAGDEFRRIGYFMLVDDLESSHVPIFSQVRESRNVTIL